MSLPWSLMLVNLRLRVFAGDVLEAGEFPSSTFLCKSNRNIGVEWPVSQ